VHSFLWEQERHLHRNLPSPQFSAFVPVIEGAYEAARFPEPLDLFVWQLFGVCHRALLLAVSIIARGAPDAASGSTRRALEAARLAFAVKYRPENATAWAAYDERRARWTARDEQRKPPPVSPKLILPPSHPLLEEVGKWIGMLSDSWVHLTPESLGDHELQQKPGMVLHPFFQTDRDELDRALRSTVASHVLVHKLFNEALGGAFTRQPVWCHAMNTISQVSAALMGSTKPPVSPNA
jgi:hypothetical protein